MERCYNIDCACFNKEEKDTACEVFTNINLCDESFPLTTQTDAAADVPCNVGLCANDLKAWLRTSSAGSKDEDPFFLYQQARMTKGALLDVIVEEVEAYLKRST